MSRALRLTPQNLGAKSEIAARADSLCRPARCSFLKKQAKNFSFALWSGGLRRACAKGWRTSAAQCLCSRIALWSGELALTLVQEAGARPRRRRRKVFAVRLQDVLAFFQKAGRVWDRVPQLNSVSKRRRGERIKVGVVGEIYVKYSPLANNNLEQFLFEQDCEVMVPGILSFMIFKVDNRLEDIRLYGGSQAKKQVCTLLKWYFTKYETDLIAAVKQFPQFTAPAPYSHLKELAGKVIGYGCKMGEGWLLTAEAMELVESGYGNVVCAQPFGCLPNHIVGKGMIRKVKNLYPQANIVPIDYDPSATQVNQENRIKLMLAVAKENLRDQEEAAPKASAAAPTHA